MISCCGWNASFNLALRFVDMNSGEIFQDSNILLSAHRNCLFCCLLVCFLKGGRSNRLTYLKSGGRGGDFFL